MFFRKLVVLLLLGLYGVPAALGPHWHHHRCTDQACISNGSSSSAAHSHCEPQSNHHCSCTHHARAADEQKNKPKDLAFVAADADHGPCAICAFYASAQNVPVIYEIISQPQLVSTLDSLETYAPSTSLTIAQARGPPVA